MMESHRSSTGRSLGGAAILGAVLIGGLGLSAPGTAQEKRERVVVENMIITRIGPDGKHTQLGQEGVTEIRGECGRGAKEESSVTGGQGKERFRTHVVICSPAEHASTPETGKRLAEALEKARAEVSKEEHLSAKGRAQAVEALEREIARLRSQGTK